MAWRRRNPKARLVARLKRRRNYPTPVRGGTRPKPARIGKDLRKSSEPISLKNPEPLEEPTPGSE